jgi:hypothetical protein
MARRRTGSEMLSSRLSVYSATNREKLSDALCTSVLLATAVAPVRPPGRTYDARRTTDRHARADTNLSHASAKFFLAPQSLRIALSLSVYTRRQALCGPEYPHCRTMGLGPLLRRPRLEWYQRRWIDAREADQPVWVAEDGSLCNAYRVSPLG